MGLLQKIKTFIFDVKAESAMNKVISIAIALFVAGILLPVGLTQIASGNYTGADPAVVTIITILLPVLAVIAIVYAFLRKK